MKKLSKSDYLDLEEQYARTPGLSDGWSASGEHYILTALLNRFGYRPRSREDALSTAEKLLSMGCSDET